MSQSDKPEFSDKSVQEGPQAAMEKRLIEQYLQSKGYTFKDRVLRHAQVVVSSGPAEKKEA